MAKSGNKGENNIVDLYLSSKFMKITFYTLILSKEPNIPSSVQNFP